MKRQNQSASSRLQLDKRLARMEPPKHFTPPVQGWIGAIRKALGMTSQQLATRMGIKQSTMVKIERSEVSDTIQLATLRRAAEALDCSLIYALIPKQPLETTVRDRARAFARNQLSAVEHSMALEDQSVGSSDIETRLDEIVRETNPSQFWK
jgi:predicted DNA-binding mobile mystery protein A